MAAEAHLAHLRQRADGRHQERGRPHAGPDLHWAPVPGDRGRHGAVRLLHGHGRLLRLPADLGVRHSRPDPQGRVSDAGGRDGGVAD